ncbi:MAG TPA: hypothetical protein VEK13_01055 [Thermoplasmata archaeon]|nr:hypothetical protein [Thermoplasmata archaeon]
MLGASAILGRFVVLSVPPAASNARRLGPRPVSTPDPRDVGNGPLFPVIAGALPLPAILAGSPSVRSSFARPLAY